MNKLVAFFFFSMIFLVDLFFFKTDFSIVNLVIILSGLSKYVFFVVLFLIGIFLDMIRLSPGFFAGSILILGYSIKTICNIYKSEKQKKSKSERIISINNIGIVSFSLWAFLLIFIYKISFLILENFANLHYCKYYLLIFDCLVSSLLIFIMEIVYRYIEMLGNKK